MALIRLLQNDKVHSATDQEIFKLKKSRRKFQLLSKSDTCVKYMCHKCEFSRLGCKCYCHSLYVTPRKGYRN